ncbi:MAG: hypothetical protein RL417_354 [Pseudomonadota bacterium]
MGVVLNLQMRLAFGLLLGAALSLWPGEGVAQSGSTEARAAIAVGQPRNTGFEVPLRLQPRVNFWIDIFTRYGKNHAVVHHRDYPQVIFGVFDFSQAAQELGPVALEKFRKTELKNFTAALSRDLEFLSTGAAPRSEVQRKLVEKMKIIPGGAKKYRETVKEDLIRSQTGIREKYIEAIERSGRYLPLIERIFVREYGLPIELTRLPFVESSFDYKAYSSVGAAGIWQFMPRTARLYMSVNNIVDERRDPVVASESAAKYLQAAYRRLGTWPLAVTSYNHGVGGVAKAVKKMGTTNISSIIEHAGDRPFGFASNNFFPSLLAALHVYENHRRYFPGLQIEPTIRFDSVRLNQAVSVGHVTKQLGISPDELRPLNYALSDSVWKGRHAIPRGYTLKVPPEYSVRLTNLRVPESRPVPAGPAASSVYGGTVYRVRKGDTLSGIAKRHGVSVAALMEMNGLSTPKVKQNQTLIVKQREGGAPLRVAPPARSEPVQPVPERATVRRYRVKKGDTLWDIAGSFDISLQKLQRANPGVSDLRPGQLVVIPD